MFKKILLGIMIVIFTSCSTNPPKLRESYIKNAINQYNQEHPICIQLIPQMDYKLTNKEIHFGDKEISIVRIDQHGKKVNKKAIAQMNILKKNKFYLQHYDEKWFDKYNNDVIYLAKYTLTSNGKKFMSENTGVCLGHAKVKKVIWFTPGVHDNSLILTNVSYSDSLEISKWGKDLLNNFNIDISDYYPVTDKKAVLFQTNNGWKDIRYLQK